MITSKEEYDKRLFEIQNQLSESVPQKALLIPANEPIYEIDLAKREIETPDFLSVSKDHTAETIYFKVDRYYEHMDLTNTICVIEYINAANEAHLYIVPYYDTMTYSQWNKKIGQFDVSPKIIFPWVISGYATKSPGIIKYAIKFYHIDRERSTLKEYFYDFILNTIPVESKILYGLDENKELDIDNDDYLSATTISGQIENSIQGARDLLNELKENGALNLYWLEV